MNIVTGFSAAARHECEEERLGELYRLGVLDTDREERFDLITGLVSSSLGFPTVLISLIDEDRQWFKSTCNLQVSETSRDVAFCAHAINERSGVMVIPDAAADDRFRTNPMVAGSPHIRFYAGIVLRSPRNLPLGTLCMIDYKPREITEKELQVLDGFARLVEQELYPDATGARWSQEVTVPDWTDFNSFAIPLKEFHAEAKALCRTDSLDNACLLIVDVPKSKQLTRTYGQAIADEMLIELAHRLRLALGDRQFILGGDAIKQFTALVSLGQYEDTVEQLVEDLTFNVGEHIQTSSVTISTPVRVGIGALNNGRMNLAESLDSAQLALDSITSTEAGITVQALSADLENQFIRQFAVASKLGDALKNNAIKVHVQPKVRLTDCRIVGGEALIRWTDPDLGAIAPPEIIHAAREIDLLTELEIWVLRTTCGLLRDWIAQGVDVVPVSINLSGNTLMQARFPEILATVIEEYAIPAGLIDFEILESAVLERLDEAVAQINAIRALGVKISLDDFGTGYSSLAYLRALPIDTLKIDRTFINDIVHDIGHSRLVRQIIDIGHSLNKTIVAEGVENLGQYLILRSYGCECIQGFYFARPMPADEFLALITSESGCLKPAGIDFL